MNWDAPARWGAEVRRDPIQLVRIADLVRTPRIAGRWILSPHLVGSFLMHALFSAGGLPLTP